MLFGPGWDMGMVKSSVWFKVELLGVSHTSSAAIPKSDQPEAPVNRQQTNKGPEVFDILAISCSHAGSQRHSQQLLGQTGWRDYLRQVGTVT